MPWFVDSKASCKLQKNYSRSCETKNSICFLFPLIIFNWKIVWYAEGENIFKKGQKSTTKSLLTSSIKTWLRNYNKNAKKNNKSTFKWSLYCTQRCLIISPLNKILPQANDIDPILVSFKEIFVAPLGFPPLVEFTIS